MPRASEAAPWVSRVGAVAPCKGKSFTPYRQGAQNWHQSLLLLPDEDFKSTFNAFALSGRDCTNTETSGCRFACPGLCAPLGFQPAPAKSETSVPHSSKLHKIFFTITKHPPRVHTKHHAAFFLYPVKNACEKHRFNQIL